MGTQSNTEQLISINEAASKGINKLRRPNWANPTDYVKIDIIEGMAGPWMHLYSVLNEEINGKNPVDVLCIEGRDDKYWLPWAAPPGA